MSLIKTMVRGAYDVQKLRIQMGNRIVENFKSKELGKIPGEAEVELGDKETKILELLRCEYKKITDGVKYFPKRDKFDGNEVISDYTELCLLEQYMTLEKNEIVHFRNLESALGEFPVYTQFLKPIKGIGSAMAGVIVSEIDIHKAKYPSSLWKYAGLDVAPNGEGRSRRKVHLVEQKYIDGEGDEMTKMGITFNPFLKTKLVGVLAGCLIKAGNVEYGEVYRNYKHRIENNPAHIEKTKGHRDNMAKRYMIKIFLIDLYKIWRKLEGLEVHPDYHEAKLGHKHDD